MLTPPVPVDQPSAAYATAAAIVTMARARPSPMARAVDAGSSSRPTATGGRSHGDGRPGRRPLRALIAAGPMSNRSAAACRAKWLSPRAKPRRTAVTTAAVTARAQETVVAYGRLMPTATRAVTNAADQVVVRIAAVDGTETAMPAAAARYANGTTMRRTRAVRTHAPAR